MIMEAVNFAGSRGNVRAVRGMTVFPCPPVRADSSARRIGGTRPVLAPVLVSPFLRGVATNYSSSQRFFFLHFHNENFDQLSRPKTKLLPFWDGHHQLLSIISSSHKSDALPPLPVAERPLFL
jgi:hypothetical protein